MHHGCVRANKEIENDTVHPESAIDYKLEATGAFEKRKVSQWIN